MADLADMMKKNGRTVPPPSSSNNQLNQMRPKMKPETPEMGSSVFQQYPEQEYFKQQQNKAPLNEPVVKAQPDKKAEEDLEYKAMMNAYKSRAIVIGMAVLCVYVLFLIYGIAVTNYGYGRGGAVEAIRMSYEDVQLLHKYNELLEYYYDTRNLYTACMDLDYQLQHSGNSSLLIASEYTGMLESVGKLSVKISAYSEAKELTTLKGQLLQWVKSDIAVYLQNISAAITNNDAEKANHAKQDQERMEQNFNNLTGNFAVIGQGIPGTDISAFCEWTPKKYLIEKAKQ